MSIGKNLATGIAALTIATAGIGATAAATTGEWDIKTPRAVYQYDSPVLFGICPEYPGTQMGPCQLGKSYDFATYVKRTITFPGETRLQQGLLVGMLSGGSCSIRHDAISIFNGSVDIAGECSFRRFTGIDYKFLAKSTLQALKSTAQGFYWSIQDRIPNLNQFR